MSRTISTIGTIRIRVGGPWAVLLAGLLPVSAGAADNQPPSPLGNMAFSITSDGGNKKPGIQTIEPPHQGFYSKLLDYDGIPIRAHRDVADAALLEAKGRLEMLLGKLPAVRQRLRAAGAELHIIGRNQVTSDLPEHRHLKGKPFEGKLTVDDRTRGLGGLLVSCGEENLLRLPRDRYRGRDICVHEFAHCIYSYGISDAVRRRFREQWKRSLGKGLWVGSYAGSNAHEFFAELSMWYFGTRGDLGMKGAKPANGRERLKAYDPEAYALLDDFYRGVEPQPLRQCGPAAAVSPGASASAVLRIAGSGRILRSSPLPAPGAAASTSAARNCCAWGCNWTASSSGMSAVLACPSGRTYNCPSSGRDSAAPTRPPSPATARSWLPMRSGSAGRRSRCSGISAANTSA